MCDEAGIFNCTSLAIGFIYVWLCSRMVTYGYTYGYVIKGYYPYPEYLQTEENDISKIL